MKLISMREFVMSQLRLTNQATPEKLRLYRWNTSLYAAFLARGIELEMFDSSSENCVFKDLEIEYTDITKKIIIKKKNGFFVITGAKKNFGGNWKIEDLVHRDLELTDNALKQMGL